MAQQFGKTWWGKSFLQALTDIDYSNRLPRGRNYARNGYVKEINTANNRIDAKVVHLIRFKLRFLYLPIQRKKA